MDTRTDELLTIDIISLMIYWKQIYLLNKQNALW